jgi:hypothetical protein
VKRNGETLVLTWRCIRCEAEWITEQIDPGEGAKAG